MLVLPPAARRRYIFKILCPECGERLIMPWSKRCLWCHGTYANRQSWANGKRHAPPRTQPARPPRMRCPRCKKRDCYVRIGRCHSCTMQLKWASGWRPRKQEHWDAYQPWELDRVRGLAGSLDADEIAEVLNREWAPLQPKFKAKKVVRTRNSVLRIGSDNGISIWPPGLSPREVAQIFGVTDGVGRMWVVRGFIEHSRRSRRNARALSYRVSEAQLEAFIRTRGYVWGMFLPRMLRGRWRSLAEVVWRADPWLFAADIVRGTPYQAKTVAGWAARGLGGNVWQRGTNGRFAIRASDLTAVLAAVDALHVDARARAVANTRITKAVRRRRALPAAA